MRTDLKGKKLLICEEALLNYKGHFYSWIKAIRTIHLHAGADVFVACGKSVDPAIKDEFNAIPVFTHNSWGGVYDNDRAWKRYAGVFLHNWRLLKETKKALTITGPVDVILLPAVRIHHLMAWRVLCFLYLGKRFNRVILFLLTSEAIYDASYSAFSFKRTSMLIKSILSGFSGEVKKGRVVLAGDSHVTANEYHSLSGVPFRVFPSPAMGLQASLVKKDKDPSGPVIFTMLGVSFIDKGIDVLQNAILQLLVKAPELPVLFVIQWALPTIDYNGNVVKIDDRLRSSEKVRLLEDVLSAEEYQSYMQQSDFMVMPYRRSVYFNRLSGVVIEAASAGIPMIVTENTWLSWALSEFGAGVTIRDGDAEDLADKIIYCTQNREMIKQDASGRKEVAREKNSSDRYLDCVWS